MIVLSQAPTPLPEDGDDVVQSTRAAAAAGWEIVSLPPDLDRLDPRRVLADLAPRDPPTPAIWIGTIPSAATYAAVDACTRARGVELVNDFAAHQAIFEFDRAYPRLEGLTPRSVIVTDVAAIDDAIATLGLPLFVKGALLSRKHFGWEACVARTREALRERVELLLARPYYSRGRVILRELAPLRAHRVPAVDFPLGREYRVFVCDGEVVGHGYYWPYPSDHAALTPDEEAAVLDLARDAAARLPAPLCSLDIGQCVDGRWIVIETGDPQFSGLSFIAPGPLWRRLHAVLARRPAIVDGDPGNLT